MNKKIAVIDMGSNSVRLQITGIDKNKCHVILEEKENIRLGEDAFDKGCFSKEAIQKALDTLKRFKMIIDAQEINHSRVVATAGLREINNRQEVLEKIRYQTGFNVEVISGTEEARLIFLGVCSNYDLQGQRILVVDIGGGSCELIIGGSQGIEDVKSLRLGCIRLTKHFLKSNPVRKEELVLLRQEIDSVFNKIKDSLKRHPFDFIIGTGGSLNNITEIIYRLKKKNSRIISRKASLQEVCDLNNELIRRSYEERLLLPALEDRRADIILAGGLLIQRIMEYFEKDCYVSLNKGLKDGLSLDTINRMGIKLASQDTIERSKIQRIWEIAHKYSANENHSRAVCHVALKLFDALKAVFHFKEEWKEYLQAAAILHDIGYHISYSKHHKHSQYLIENSELIGFSESEIHIISNIARYHRKSLPKISHKKFKDLSILEKDIVMQMAAVLRIADAMDRRHTGSFQNFQVRIFPDSIRVMVQSKEEDFYLEREGILKKSDLFHQIYHRRVVLETSQ